MLYFVVIAALVSLSGCISLYHPNAAQTPLFTNAGEVHGAAHIGMTGGDLQVAYSPFTSVGVMAAAAYNSNSIVHSLGSDDERHRYIEAALGYYIPQSTPLRTEFLGGMGLGSSVDHSNEDSPDGQASKHHGNYHRYFVQGTIGSSDHFLKNDWLREFGLALRFSYLKFQEVYAGDELLDVPGTLFMEPVLFGRVGKGGVMIEGELGGSLPSGDFRFDWQYLRFTVGLHLILGREGS